MQETVPLTCPRGVERWRLQRPVKVSVPFATLRAQFGTSSLRWGRTTGHHAVEPAAPLATHTQAFTAMHPFSSIQLSLAILGAFIPVSNAHRYPASIPSVQSGSDTIQFAALRVQRGERECSSTVEVVCRMRRQFSAQTIQARLAAHTPVWREGSDITFATEATAESVDLSGGLQYPMSRLAGTDLWVVTLRVAQLDNAVISYFFMPAGPRIVRPARFKPSVWRGPAAPPPALEAAEVKGRVVVDTLPSRFLSEPRSIITYVPPARANAPISAVVYLGDGGSVTGLAAVLDTLIVTGALPRVMLVGIESAMSRPGDPTGFDPRAMEYLWGFEDTNKRFLAHERFWLEEVIPFAERKYNAPADRTQRATWGISNSGAWSIQMGLRHPDVIGNVIAFSPGGSHGVIEPGSRFEPRVRFYLQGGKLEPPFDHIALSWVDSLKPHGLDVIVREPIAGHDWAVWRDLFPDAVRWAFASTPGATPLAMRDDRRSPTAK